MAHYKAIEELRPDAVRQNQDSLPTQLHGTEPLGYIFTKIKTTTTAIELKKPRGKVTDNTNELPKASSANHNTSPMVGKGLASASPFFYGQVDLPGGGRRKKERRNKQATAPRQNPFGAFHFFLPTALFRAKPGQRKKKQASRLTLLINPLSFL